jgi:hypothetical protein
MRAGIRVAQKVRRIPGQISVQQNNVGAAPGPAPSRLRYRYDLDVVFCVEGIANASANVNSWST